MSNNITSITPITPITTTINTITTITTNTKQTCINYIKKIISTQDFTQRLYMIMSVTIELYRIFVSSLLIVFVTQNCDGHVCSFGENLIWTDTKNNIGILCNFITLFGFIVLYIFEITRENKLIKYLEVNPQNPRDNESLEIIFENIPLQYRNKIYKADYYYEKFTFVCVFLFIINTTVSGFVIYDYSLGNQTTTTFITNVLFMITKVYDTYCVANTEKSVFYSAYLREHVQFNDIDPSLKAKLQLDDIEMGIELIHKKKSRRSNSILENEPEPGLITEENIKIDDLKRNKVEELDEPNYEIYKNINETGIEVTEKLSLKESTELNNDEFKEIIIDVKDINNNIDVKEYENLIKSEK
jgi:hypothetical protein